MNNHADELFPRPSPGSQAMNRLILAAAGRAGGVETGGVARLAGESPEHGSKLRQAYAAAEVAEQRGDPDEIAFAEHLLDRAVEEWRASRERPRDPSTGQYVPREHPGEAGGSAFNGGVRGRKAGPMPPPGHMQPPTGRELMIEGFRQSLQERGDSAIGWATSDVT
jgi:hypothetical protein